jgi:hypothetical protein
MKSSKDHSCTLLCLAHLSGALDLRVTGATVISQEVAVEWINTKCLSSIGLSEGVSDHEVRIY